ncbi:hypothetical protein EYC80_007444 [Monilinia laxa]|uniref:Uncharacterized protein n=1 Tax=Monilinia laxa TaxID=61186 RepID=A0A5N6JVN2_MONLA|nr:hypothetical protein EYC80_007444 [Monilinia laxa]
MLLFESTNATSESEADNTPLATADLESFIFPTGLIEETIRSLALLIRQNYKDCRRWFKKVSASEGIDRKAIQCGRLQAEDRRIEKFKFWGERLSILKEVFDEAEPGFWRLDCRRGGALLCYFGQITPEPL